MTALGNPWQPLRENVRALGRLLKHITCCHPCYAKLLLEVDDAAESGPGPSEQSPHDSTWSFSSVTHPEPPRALAKNLRNFQSCELRLGDWIKSYAEVMRLAQKCGRAML